MKTEPLRIITMARKTKIAVGIVASLALIVVIGGVVVATFDWNRVKPTINERVTAAIGRPFAINGDLSVRWEREVDEGGWRALVPWPHIVANDITVANTPWAKSPNFATLQRGEFSLALLPLLQQRVQIRRIQLTEPTADLERLKDGRANWVFTLPETGQPSPWVLDINEIGFDKGRIGFVDEMLSTELNLVVDPLTQTVPFADIAGANFAPEDTEAPAPHDYVFGWTVTGRYKGLPLKGDGKVGGMLALQDARQPFPVQADVSIGGTKAAVAGTLTDPLNFGALDLRLKLSGGSMAQLYPLIGVTLPDTPPYSTDGHLVARLKGAGGALFEYRDFRGKVGASDLSGDLTFKLGLPRAKLTGKLYSKLLRMVDLGPLIGVQSGPVAAATPTGAKSDGPKAPASGKVLPTQAFRTDRWRDMDADVDMTGDRIQHSGVLPISGLNVHLVLQDGQLTLDPLRFGMAGGNIDANIKLDGSKAAMTGVIKTSARRLRLKQLFPATPMMQKTLGELNGDLAISGSGNSVAALLGTASGDAKLLVNDGVVSRGLLEIAGLNMGNYIMSKLFGDDEVKINCAAADVQMKDGLATPRFFVIDTENARIKVEGTANFKNETLDLTIDPESKGFRIFSLRSPLYVRGTFAAPSAGVKVLPLAARGAGMVALGVLLTPAAGLLALIAPSTTEDNQCGPMLKQMQQPVKAPVPPRGKR